MRDEHVSAPIVHAEQLGRRFGKQRWAVRNIDLDVGAGEMVGIVGPDGAGKTTLMQMLAAILDPSEGTCSVFGLDSRTAGKAIGARLGYMTQGFTLYDRLTVDENLRLAGALRGLAPAIYAERRERLLAMAGLERFTARPAGQLSGGMRKKLSLCTNLVHEPDLLILDEPGLGVDPLSRRQLWEMLAAFRQRGIATVVATSYMDEAERCDRLVLLREGSVLANDSPDNVRRLAAGRVFEASAAQPVTLAQEVSRLPGVHAVQILPNRIRFQRSAGLPALADERVRPADAVLEDVFALDETGDIAEAAVAPIALDHADRGGIVTEGLSISFGAFRAVDKVSLTVRPGELLALLGPNGAGKTTLIRSLCGLVRPAKGRARVAGIDLGARDAVRVRDRIGYMSQRFSLYPDLTPRENLAFFANAYGLSGSAAHGACRWACARTGLDEGDQRLVEKLSGAEHQRLALACSILHRPSVLFLDEPTSGIDPVARYRFWSLIRALAAAGMTILVTTHYLDEAAYCDRIGLMHRGQLIAHGTLAELRAQTGSDAQASVETVFISALGADRAQEANA